MLILEVEYLHYLCRKSLSVNNILLNRYIQCSDTNYQDDIDSIYLDNELNDFIIELVSSAEYWINVETAYRNEALVKDYYRLDDLIKYMHSIKYLKKKNEVFIMNKSICVYPMGNYGWDNSRLLSYEIDGINHTCSIILSSVIFYNDKRQNKRGDAIVIKFIDTKYVKMKGKLNTEESHANYVFSWYMLEIDEGLKCFYLFVLDGNEPFLLKVNHTDVNILPYY